MMIFKKITRKDHDWKYSCLMQSRMSPTIGPYKLGMPGLPDSDPLCTGRIPPSASIDGPISPTLRDPDTEILSKHWQILIIKLRRQLRYYKTRQLQCGTAQICGFLRRDIGRVVWGSTTATCQSFSFQCCRICLDESFRWPTCTTRWSKMCSPITLRESITMRRV